MAIYRVNKTKDYTTIANYHLREKEMSLKAKGLLTLFLSLPDDWDYSSSGITKIVKESRNTVNEIMKELEKFNYLKRTMLRNNKGIIKDWQYDIYEKPYTNYQDMENQDIDNQDIENEAQLNTNKVSTNKLNNIPPISPINKIDNEKYFENDELNELFIDFLKVRKKIGAVNSDRAIKLLINKLDKYDDYTKTKMIEQSIENSWKGLFEVKNITPPKPKIKVF